MATELDITELQGMAASLDRHGGIDAAYLLGTAAAGQMRPDSDVDIAVLPAAGCDLSILKRGELAAELALRIGRDVDLGLLSSRNVIYARQAILTGRRFYVRDRRRADLLAATLLGMYERFDLDRREVRDAYSAR